MKPSNAVRRLLIDDCRSETCLMQEGHYVGKPHVIARDYWEGLKQLKENGPWDLLYLDHDLQSYYEEDGKTKEKTGYDIMLYLESAYWCGDMTHVPKDILCVSSNPAGRKRINQVIAKIT